MAGEMTKSKRLANYVANLREKHQETIGHAVNAAVAGGTGVALGALDTKYPNIVTARVPNSGIAALALLGLGFFQVGGKYNEQLHTAGQTALGIWGYSWGKTMLGGSAGVGVSDAELDELRQGVR
jgi:hypothetical protein